MSDVVDKLLKKANTEIQRARKRRKEIKRHSETIEAVHALFPECYFFPFHPRGVINIYNAKGFTSHDNPDLLTDLEAIENLGFFFDSCDDFPEDNFRRYNFTHPNNFTLSITVWLANDSACQRVIVGYQEAEENITVNTTKPIYKFQC